MRHRLAPQIEVDLYDKLKLISNITALTTLLLGQCLIQGQAEDHIDISYIWKVSLGVEGPHRFGSRVMDLGNVWKEKRWVPGLRKC